MHYEFTYKQRKILADFTRYFSTGSFACENCAPLQSCVTCWFVCFFMFVAEFRHQMLNPQQVNNPVGERPEKKVQDHQLLQTRANHAEQWRRVCYFFFFLPVCSSALLRLKSYSAAVTFLNSSLAVDFCAFCHRKSLPIWLVSSVETEELHIPFIPASFWNKRLSRDESCLLLSHAHPQQNSFQLGLIVSLMVPELQLHGQ